MTTLSLSYLGPFRASLVERTLQKFRTNKTQALLIYLTTEAAFARGPVTHRRETLMELLWPDLPLKSAQVNLRQTLYRLRQAIPELKAVDSNTVQLMEICSGISSKAIINSPCQLCGTIVAL